MANNKWAKERKKQKEEHIKLIKDIILSFIKSGHLRLSEIEEQTQIYPLYEMSKKKFKEFLESNGYKLVEIKDYLIHKK